MLMLRYIWLLLIVFFFNGKQLVQAQVYGNEWIVQGQTYYKIPTAQTGIYAISGEEFALAGGLSGSISNMQLFHRSIEQNILVRDNNNNGIFDSNDSLFFYGQKNDGTLDSVLYNPPSAQPHKYYNVYSDTTAYFLTFGSANGKRMQVISNTGGVKQSYHLNEHLKLYTDYYWPGMNYGQNTGSTFYVTGDYGEGFASLGFNGDGSTGDTQLPPITYAIPVTNIYLSTPVQPYLEILLVGITGDADVPQQHIPQIVFPGQSRADTVFLGQTFNNENTLLYTQSVDPGLINDTTLKVKVNCIGPNGNDWMAYFYIKLTYPQYLTMEGLQSKYFNIPANGQISSLQIGDANGSYTIFDVTDKNNVNIIPYSLSNDTINTSVNSSNNIKLLVNSNNNYLKVSSIKKVDLTEYPTSQYLVISHPSLIEGGSSGVSEYAAYRSSAQGGGYNTLVADITKLYDIHSYGEASPVAIKRFVSYQYNKGNPEYLFIIGKGLSPDYSLPSNSYIFYRQDPSIFAQTFNSQQGVFVNLVPTYGYPGSDLLFSMNLNPSNPNVPVLATGRLSASSDSVVKAYLTKVQEHEMLDSTMLWRKNLIHVSGGNTDDGGAEVTTFAGYLLELKPIAEDTLFGGKVIASFTKSSASTVDEQLRSGIINLLNTQGASYLTFFGHSAADITDVDLGYPSQAIYGYDNGSNGTPNSSKYPFLFLNSCLAGDCFDGYSFVEDFLNTPNKGAIGALAHSGEGYENTLDNYARTFYDVAFQNGQTMLKSIGQIQLEILNIYYSNYVTDPISRSNAQEMIIQGDPALRVYTPSKPDYSIVDPLEEQVFIKSYNGQPVTAISDSFAIGIIVSNFGTVTAKDSFDVTITRTYGTTTVTYGPLRFPPVFYEDTIYFTIKSKDRSTYGENSFTITIDPHDKIAEMNKQNNTATLGYYIPFSGIITLSPPDYAIVNSSMLNTDKSISLVAQSTDLTIEPTDYFIEIDTSYLFTSPYKKSAVVDAPALLKWNTTLVTSLPDSQVYYWRTRFNNIAAGQDTAWAQSSFIYIPNSPPGWSQSQFPQFLYDSAYNISLNGLSQKTWQFNVVNTEITVRAVGDSFPEPSGSTIDPSQWQSYMGLLIEIDNTPLYYGTTVYATKGCSGYYEDQGAFPINVMTFSRKTALPYIPNFSTSSNLCGIDPPLFINVLYDPAVSQYESSFISYINAVENGDYTLFVTTWAINFQNWSTSLKDSLKSIYGLTLIDSVKNGDPYLFLARKNSGKPIFERYSNSIYGSVYMDTTIIGRQDTGYIASTIIGPAASWGTVYKTIKNSDTTDHYDLQIIGIDNNNNDSILVKKVPSDTFNISNINAAKFPYLQLEVTESDTVNLTPPQLKKWQVIFSQVPEGTLDLYKAGLQNYQYFTKQEGDTIHLSFIFENISAYNFPDSLKVKFIVTNESGKTLIKYITLPPLKSDTSVTFNCIFNTYGFSGNNTFEVYVNPKLQPEENYDNNIATVNFFIIKDQTAPVLDVVFDGVHIMDGDIVSPSPVIAITLTDNNQYLIKNDTTGMSLLLLSPGQSTPQKISLNNNSSVKYGQSTGSTNSFVIDYNPQNLRDGVYTLYVQGADVSGNTSGGLQYQIQFQVINESTVTNFYPYPNPFSSQTRFVFTLTGSDIPEDIIIEIINVTGKIVKELTKNDLGPIHIGNNITEPWNGTDEYGDRLANGLYLYNVKLKGNNSSDFAHRSTSADIAFKKGFGKLYILR